MMNGEDPPERPENINAIIEGLERYNPEAVGTLEAYLGEQCEEKFCDCNANRTLLKLYQLNPDRMQNEIVTNILVKALTQFPSAQFSLALHLVSPSVAASSHELTEALAKLRALNAQLESAQYAAFWASLDGDDLCADLMADIAGFEDLVRGRIADLVGQAYRELPPRLLAAWLGLDEERAIRFVVDGGLGWSLDSDDDASAKVLRPPTNQDNEAKKTEIREDVGVEMFSRVIRRSWEETVQ